ncbi:hypothetical protein [Apibacter muscae]|nr:hypothetical protein [Apibacter muscae]
MATIAMLLMLVVFIGTFKRWLELLNMKTLVTDKYGDSVKQLVER